MIFIASNGSITVITLRNLYVQFEAVSRLGNRRTEGKLMQGKHVFLLVNACVIHALCLVFMYVAAVAGLAYE